jgi:hypothetical protein
LAVSISEVFSFREDWHQHDRARPLVHQYQLTLNALLRDRPDLRDCAVRCRHCGIRFFTHPRNRRRQDLHCPFGCRQHHRRQKANARSRKHARTAVAKRKKKRLNGRRGQSANTATPPNSPPGNDSPLGNDSLSTESSGGPEIYTQPQLTFSDALSGSSSSDESLTDSSNTESFDQFTSQEIRQPTRENEVVLLDWDGAVLQDATFVNSRSLPHVCMVASLIEGRTVSRDELIVALRKSMRQRCMGRSPRREYVLRYLNQHPP